MNMLCLIVLIFIYLIWVSYQFGKIKGIDEAEKILDETEKIFDCLMGRNERTREDSGRD